VNTELHPVRTGLCAVYLTAALCGAPCSGFADEASAEPKNRLELSASYDFLSPHNAYGDWETVSAAFYRKERADFTWYSELDAFTRKEGKGALVVVGAYKDWLDRLYTYSAVSLGTNALYLPQTRLDHTFNIKFGPDRKYVWLVGGTWVRYYTPHRDFILSTGLTAYLGEWIPEYRIFRNISSPGAVVSYSHLLSLAYGKDRHRWTTLVLGYGKQAYQATEPATPAEVASDSLSVSLKHRKWLKDNYGWMGEINYFDLQGSYQRGGVLFGVFREF